MSSTGKKSLAFEPMSVLTIGANYDRQHVILPTKDAITVYEILSRGHRANFRGYSSSFDEIEIYPHDITATLANLGEPAWNIGLMNGAAKTQEESK